MALGMIAFVLGIAWILGFFVFHMGAAIHLVLAIAVILTIVRMAKKPLN